jgi:hypothetical protein
MNRMERRGIGGSLLLDGEGGHPISARRVRWVPQRSS